MMLARYPTTTNLTARENFNRTWKEYREGFGDLHGEFWIGTEGERREEERMEEGKVEGKEDGDTLWGVLDK